VPPNVGVAVRGIAGDELAWSRRPATLVGRPEPAVVAFVGAPRLVPVNLTALIGTTRFVPRAVEPRAVPRVVGRAVVDMAVTRWKPGLQKHWRPMRMLFRGHKMGLTVGRTVGIDEGRAVRIAEGRDDGADESPNGGKLGLDNTVGRGDGTGEGRGEGNRVGMRLGLLVGIDEQRRAAPTPPFDAKPALQVHMND